MAQEAFAPSQIIPDTSPSVLAIACETTSKLCPSIKHSAPLIAAAEQITPQ